MRKITYFDVRGRAEVIRLILEDQSKDYTEHRVTLEEWPQMKTTLDYGQLPTYQEDGLVLNQSNAIYRYLARKYDLYGCNELERIRCDMLQETFVDLQNNIGTLFWNPDFENVRAAYEANELQTNLARLQGLLVKNRQGTGYWVGDNITYIDYIAWHHLEYVRALSAATLATFPQLAHFKQRLEDRPRIAAYLASNRRPKTLTVAMASFGGTPETS